MENIEESNERKKYRLEALEELGKIYIIGNVFDTIKVKTTSQYNKLHKALATSSNDETPLSNGGQDD